MPEISISLHIAQDKVSVQVVRDKGHAIEVPAEMRVQDLIPYLVNIAQVTLPNNNPRDYCTLLVSRPVTDPMKTLADLDLESGDALTLIMHHHTINLLLIPNNELGEPLRIRHSPTVIGRIDAERVRSQPDVSLLPLLPEDHQQAVSQRQAELYEQEGLWYVKLLGRAPMHVNSQPLKSGDSAVMLQANDVISFGHDPNRPILQLTVAFETED